jgi:type IV pilus assembly protein PilN
MRITVNLATRPFIELRPFFMRLRVLMLALAVLGVGALIATHVLEKKLDVAQGQINEVHAKVVAAQQEKRSNERRMRQPENAAVLSRAQFLNALFLAKSFSWTAVMMDLETVLPSGVQVTSIEPQISADGNVVIRLRVSGERDRAVQLVRNLERSKRFLSPRLTGEASQAKENGNRANGLNDSSLAAPGVEFEILADYNPLPAGEMYSGKEVKAETGSDDSTAVKHARRGATGGSKGHGVMLKRYSASHPNKPNGGVR